MADHAKLSPSAAKRWMNCPGSIHLSEGIGNKSSVYAEEGTAAHKVAEYCLANGLDAKGFLTQAASALPEHAKYITEEMLDSVQVYLDTIYRDMVETLGAVLLIEKRITLDWLVPGMFGRNDALLGEAFGLLRVYDLKHGAGIPVEVKDNPQLMIYALGAIGEGNPSDYEEVEMVIVQPRCPHTEGPVHRHRMKVEELFTWAKKELVPAAKAALDTKSFIKAGDWCQFCPAMAVCPEMAREAYAVAQAEFAADNAEISLPDPEALNENQIARVLEFSSILSSWAREVAVHAQSLMEAGRHLPGYKLVQKRSNRQWKDEAAAAKTLQMVLGDEIYTPSALKSPAQVEKIPGAKGLIEDLWHKPDAGLTIASENDKRPAAALPAAADFSPERRS